MAFDKIPFTDLVLHCLLDDFEFSAHAFEDLKGPYYLNSIGIDFTSPFPEEDVLKEAKRHKSKTIFLAHTHPLTNDESLDFVQAKNDPREEIAYGIRQLPLGNGPSTGDIEFFNKVKESYGKEGIVVTGLVFSASGVWEYDVDKIDISKFKTAYAKFNPLPKDDIGWTVISEAKSKFPNYFMEIQKPKLRRAEGYITSYKTRLQKVKDGSTSMTDHEKNIARYTSFFSEHGVKLTFHLYSELDIDPIVLMRKTMSKWTDMFV